MPQLQRQAVSNYRLGTIEDFRQIRPIMNAFNTNADQVNKRLYFSQFPTTTAVAAGTVSDSPDQPILARKYENNGSIIKYGTAGRPASVNDTIGKRVTVASASDGITFSGLTFSITGDYICFVMKPSTAITLTVSLITSLGNLRAFAFTTSSFTADSNGYVRFISPTAVGTYTGVTVSNTGTFNAASITSVSVIGSATSTIDCYDIQEGPNIDTFIGHQVSLAFECLDEATIADTLETADRKCGLYTVGKSGTGLTLDITLKVRELNAKSQAAAKGEVLKRGSVNVPIIQNASIGGLTSLAISAGAMTIAGQEPTRIALVKVGNAILDRVENVGDVGPTTYHYNSGTGAFTFSTIYNSQTPTIIIMSSTTGTYFERKNLKTGFVGPLTITRTSDTGKTVIYEFLAAEIVNVEMTQEDSEVSHTYSITCTPFEDGGQFRFYRQIEL